jgi:acetyltransferase-like isoleucine patch superfamily enzyme
LPSSPFPDPRKQRLSKAQRGVRAALSALDPRAWLHLIKIVNYYNHTHVTPIRRVRFGAGRSVSPDVVFSNPARIIIGDRVRLGSRCHLWAGPRDGHIRIGDDVLFGPEVMVTAATYNYNDGRPVTEQTMREADVVIGDDVWIATRVVILPGAVIGNGAIVAAGAVVKGEVPPFAIVAGNPGRVVGARRPS